MFVHVRAQEPTMAEKLRRYRCLINQHQKTALKMDGTRSNSLAKVNYSSLRSLPTHPIKSENSGLFFFTGGDPV